MPKRCTDVKYSVFINVCAGDTADGFSRAFQSIKEQIPPPDQIVVCADDLCGELLEKVRACEGLADIIYISSNGDHAKARNAALSMCRNEIVGVMDADDVALKGRFKTLLEIMYSSNAHVVGGAIREFDKISGKRLNVRSLPKTDSEIKKYLKKRCPFNHMTVIYKKSAVQKCGGYRSLYCNEDYFLWVRMAQNGFLFANTDQVLCLAGVSDSSYARRGGVEFFESEKALQSYMLDNGMISRFRYVSNVTIRFAVQRLMPVKMRKMFYSVFLRRKR